MCKDRENVAFVNFVYQIPFLKKATTTVAALRRAVELDPAQPDAHYRLGRVYQAMGKTLESQKQFAKHANR